MYNIYIIFKFNVYTLLCQEISTVNAKLQICDGGREARGRGGGRCVGELRGEGSSTEEKVGAAVLKAGLRPGPSSTSCRVEGQPKLLPHYNTPNARHLQGGRKPEQYRGAGCIQGKQAVTS
jgi:hypothetical protein